MVLSENTKGGSSECTQFIVPQAGLSIFRTATLEAYPNASATWMRQTTADSTHANINKQAVCQL